jgi:hypothetical protein
MFERDVVIFKHQVQQNRSIIRIMLNYAEYKNKYLNELRIVGDESKSEEDSLLLYAQYIGDKLEHNSLLVKNSGGIENNIQVEALKMDIGQFNAQYCADILDADRVFMVRNDDFGFTFVGANGKQGEWYNKLASILWAVVFKQDENIFGDVLLIRNDDFVDN